MISAEALKRAVARRLSPRKHALLAAAQWLTANEPEARAHILRRAGDALDGRITISGAETEPVFVGNPPAWKEIRTPDNHYGSDLNRMLHWPYLLHAYLLTGDLTYAHRVGTEMEDWIVACQRPPLPGRDDDTSDFYSVDAERVPWHCLCSGIRQFETWRLAIEVIHDTDAMPPERLLRAAYSMREQAEAIRAVSPRLFRDANHNHYLMEMLGVLATCALFPELPEAPAWAASAVHELDRCAAAQLTDDGAQVEGCPSYHDGCVYWFCLAKSSAAASGLCLSADSESRIRRALAYSLQATRACGTSVPWGDSEPGSGYVKSALLALSVFGDPGPLRQIRGFADSTIIRQAFVDSIWAFADLDAVLQVVDEPRRPDAASPLPLVSWQRGVKQVALRSAWGREALSVFFACHSPVHYGNHPHIDPCGFDFGALGKPLVVDPGIWPYYESEARRQIKSATGHNMLTVNFREPFEYCSSFAYGPQKEGQIDWIQDDPGLQAVQGHHRNYEPAVHTRAIAIVDGRFVLILDRLVELFWLSSVQLYFQINSQTVKTCPDPCQVYTDDADANVTICVSSPLVRTTAPHKSVPGLTEKGLTRVRFDDFGESHTTQRCYATLLIPFAAKQRHPHVSDLRLTHDGIASFVLNGMPYQFHWQSDGLVQSQLA